MESTGPVVRSRCSAVQSYLGTPCTGSATASGAAVAAVAGAFPSAAEAFPSAAVTFPSAAEAFPSPAIAWETQCIAVEAEVVARSQSAGGRTGQAAAVLDPVDPGWNQTGPHIAVDRAAGNCPRGRNSGSSTWRKFGVPRRVRPERWCRDRCRLDVDARGRRGHSCFRPERRGQEQLWPPRWTDSRRVGLRR